jgi:hypothetical protein
MQIAPLFFAGYAGQTFALGYCVVHERHEKHERTLFASFVIFVSFVDKISCSLCHSYAHA